MKNDQTIIRKNLMEPLHFITKLLDIKDPNIQFMDIVNRDTHKEIIAKLNYDSPNCPDCGSLMSNMTFKNHLRFLTSKQLVCLLEFFLLENAVLSAISVQKWRPLNFSRQEKSPNPLYHQPKDSSKIY